MCIWRKRRRQNYQAALNLVYDKNIHTLRTKVKVLIVDDETFEIVDLLRTWKYDVYYKKDITYAIEAEAFDIIIIDIAGIASALKSSMGGFAIAEEIKKRYPWKQVWCYSGNLLKEEIASRISRIDGYIGKDTDIDKWNEKLDNIIETYSSNDYRIDVFRKELKKCGLGEKDIDKVIKEYKKSLEVKNFNSVVELLSELIKNGKQVLGLIQMIYSFASLFTA